MGESYTSTNRPGIGPWPESDLGEGKRRRRRRREGIREAGFQGFTRGVEYLGVFAWMYVSACVRCSVWDVGGLSSWWTRV
jgi:hypothetical protein